MKRRALLGTLLGCTTAGCLRVTEGGGQTATARSSATDEELSEQSSAQNGNPNTPTGTETDTATKTLAKPTYPVGISEDGVEGFLMETNKRALSQRGFRTTWTIVNLTDSHVKERKTHTVADNRARGEWTYDEGGTVTLYQDFDGGFWREDLGSRYTYGEKRDGYSIGGVLSADWISPILTQGVWSEPTRSNDRRPARWETTITDFDETTTRVGFLNGEFTELTGSMVVDERGIIHELQATFAFARENGRTVSYQIRSTIDSIGSVSVTTPEWLETAKERRPTVSASLTDDRNYVRLTVESGNRIEPNSRFTVYDETEKTNAIAYNLTDPIEKGETVYFYREQEGGHGRLARESRPTDASPLTFENEYTVWAARGSVEYFGTVDI